MSADLLAAFGGTSEDDSNHETEHEQHNKPFISQPHKIEDNAEDTWQPWPSRAEALPRRQERGGDIGLWKPDQQGQNVLFDADDFAEDKLAGSDDDDFGDFEEANVTRPRPQSQRSTTSQVQDHHMDLLSLDDVSVPTQTADRVGPGGLEFGISASQSTGLEPTSASTVNPYLADDDDWGAFEDVGASNVAGNIHSDPSTYKAIKSHTRSSSSKDQGRKAVGATRQIKQPASTPQVVPTPDDEFDVWDDFESGSTPQRSEKLVHGGQVSATLGDGQLSENTDHHERPTNIPPPAALLFLVPKAISKISSQTSLARATGQQALEAYTTIARLIAGRGYRWKRDSILAQSMRIGVAGRSGGMKLTSIDKGESRKEEQALEDAISAWQQHAARLNANMVKAGLRKPPMSLSSSMVVRTATGADILTDARECALCGLKRNERVNGIDTNVSDIFGEFWIEHWGHKSCSDFWYRWRGLLEQR